MVIRKDGVMYDDLSFGTITMEVTDNVNHPKHYETGKYECIDVMIEIFGKEKVMAFCQLNAFKYLYRSDRKNGTEDMDKAQWYLNEYKELENM